MRSVIDSGWPIAILGMSEIKGVLRRPKPKRNIVVDDSADDSVDDGDSTVEVPNRVRLAVSDLGKLMMFDDRNWIVDDDRPPRLAAYLEPDGPDGISLLISEIGNGRTFSVSFCDKVIEPRVVESALRRMCTDPVGILQASQK